MKTELILLCEPIDEPALLVQRQLCEGMGAVVHFLGVVRGSEQGSSISALEYEAFQPMVEHQFHRIFRQVEQRWPIHSIRLIHRVGVVPAGEPSLWVEVMAPHRQEAFAACQFLIEEMKRVVPIWKKPIGAS